MFGLAVLEMYHALKDAIDFRTFFNIAEPTQPVWWIDTLWQENVVIYSQLQAAVLQKNRKYKRTCV